MSTFITTENLATRIKAHLRLDGMNKKFYVPEIRASLPYSVITEKMEPDVPLFWGYCSETKKYFVSEKVPAEVQTIILNIEYRRTQQNLTHAQATEKVFTDNKHCKQTLLQTLLTYYQWLRTSYDSGTPCEDSLDVNDTIAYLEKQRPSCVPA